MQPVSKLHATARKFAANGVPVFPCAPGTKEPTEGSRGFHDATTDLAQIDAWWTAEPNLNVAFCPHQVGLAVIDPDGEAGEASWAEWQIEHGEMPETYTVLTPRGGRHLYYRGILPATQSKLGPHVDTRGVGSYVLVPPSYVEGHGFYTVIDKRAPVDLPETVPAFLEQLRRDAAKAAVGELDLGPNVERARRLLLDYVKRGHVAVEGQMGDGTTFAVACEVMNLGVSEETAFKLLCDHWNEHCVPPWDEDELRIKVENAARYAQNEAGSWAVETGEAVFAAALDKLALDDTPDPSPRTARFKLWTLEELGALPPPDWLVHEMLPAGGISLMFGPPGSYKSFLALQLALGVACCGQEVVYIGAEGGRGLEVRASAWKLANEVEGQLPIHIVREMPWASDGEMVEQFITAVKSAGVKPGLVVVDTAARMMVGLDENNAKDAGLFVAALEALQRALGCAILVIHHTGKDVGRGARGSNALIGAVDAAVEVQANKETRAVAIWCRRQKDAPERETPWTYQGRDFGGSMVFFPTTPEEHRAATHADELLAPKKIGAILRELKAVGIENAVTTHVLALELHKSDDLGEEAREATAARTVRLLARKAKGPLEAYSAGSGPDLVWYVV